MCELLFKTRPVCFFEIVNHTFYFSFLRDIEINIKTYKFVVSVQNVFEPLYVSNFVRNVGEDKIQSIICSCCKVDQLPQVVVFEGFGEVVGNEIVGCSYSGSPINTRQVKVATNDDRVKFVGVLNKLQEFLESVLDVVQVRVRWSVENNRKKFFLIFWMNFTH